MFSNFVLILCDFVLILSNFVSIFFGFCLNFDFLLISGAAIVEVEPEEFAGLQEVVDVASFTDEAYVGLLGIYIQFHKHGWSRNH